MRKVITQPQAQLYGHPSTLPPAFSGSRLAVPNAAPRLGGGELERVQRVKKEERKNAIHKY